MAAIKTFAGKYGDKTLESNSLTANQLKMPAIYSKMIRLYPQYSLTYLTEGTGRVKQFDFNTEEWGSDKYEWFMKGRQNKPLTGVEVLAGLGTSELEVRVNENYANPFDVLKTKSGKLVIVEGECQGSGPYVYKIKAINGDQMTGTRSVLTAADIPAGSKLNMISNLHYEKSKQGYANIGYPDKYVNFLSKHRRGFTVTGDVLGDVTWIENSKGGRMWYFTAETEVEDQFFKMVDNWRIYGRNTMKTDGTPLFYMDGKPMVAGDGLLAQIEGINDYSFSSNDAVNKKALKDYIQHLTTRSKDFKNNRWVVIGGAKAERLFSDAMEDTAYDKASVMIPYGDIASGKPLMLGGNFTGYRYGTNTITFTRIASFDDDTLHQEVDSDGDLLESSRMVFMNMGQVENESNLTIAVKKSLKGNRGILKKYIPGMIDPFNPNSVYGMNGSDGFDVEWLNHSGLVVKNPYGCGQWVRTS